MARDGSTRPRGGQVWRDKASHAEVLVESRRKTRPMASVRHHSDMVWSIVAWSTKFGGGFCHETDFAKRFEFVRGPAAAGGEPHG